MTAHAHPWPKHARQLKVDDLVVDLRYRVLRAPGHEVELPARMFGLLQVFLAQPHVLHSRESLFERAWPGVIVEDANLSHAVWILRKALGEPRKHWIRTVAKSGYVFEPPQPVVAVEIAASTPVPVPGEEALADDGAHATKGGLVSRRWIAAALIAVLALAWLGFRLTMGARRPPPADVQQVSLLIAGQAGAAAEDRWPATVLRTQLEWMLDSLPETRVATPAHLVLESKGPAPLAVFLGTTRQGAGQVVLRATWEHKGEVIRLEAQGTPDHMTELASELAAKVVARLLPQRDAAAWPRLVLPASVARQYAQGVEALDRRDWSGAARVLETVLAQAPEAGLVRLQLSRALARLSRAAPAIEQARLAQTQLVPLPKDASINLAAERLARDPQRALEAARAYADLSRSHPGRRDLDIAQVRLLLQAHRPKQAMVILERPGWEAAPLEDRVAWHLGRAEVALVLGDARLAKVQAQHADTLAKAAGSGWEAERGEAWLLLARTEGFARQYQADTTPYERAAEQFELAGDDMNAQMARFMAVSNWAGEADERADALLALARERGYPGLEVRVLRTSAYSAFRRGEMATFRQRLEKALAAAMRSGDLRHQFALELDLLNDDQLRGQINEVERRLAKLRQWPVQGDDAAWVAQFDALVATARGEYARADQMLLAATRLVSHGEGAVTAAGRLACMRFDPAISRGHVRSAQQRLRECAGSGQPDALMRSRIGLAQLDLFLGRTQPANEALVRELDGLHAWPDGPDRWNNEIVVASLLLRAGDAERALSVFDRVRPLAVSAGYGWLTAWIDTGAAEAELALGRPHRAITHLQQARAQPSSGWWTLRSRQSLVAASLAMGGKGDSPVPASLVSLYEQARRLGDVPVQLQALDLAGSRMPGCDGECVADVKRRSAMPGASAFWLEAVR